MLSSQLPSVLPSMRGVETVLTAKAGRRPAASVPGSDASGDQSAWNSSAQPACRAACYYSATVNPAGMYAVWCTRDDDSLRGDEVLDTRLQ